MDEQVSTQPTEAVEETPAPKLSEAEVASMQQRLSALEGERQELHALLKEMRDQLQANGVLGDAQCEVETISDPYEDNNPFRIDGSIPPDDMYPEGQVLRWLSPHYRDRRGMRGWEYMCWGDTYAGPADGSTLRSYGIPDPPTHVAESGKLNAQVMRNGMALGRLDRRVYDARRRRAQIRAEHNRMSSGQFTTVIPRGGSAFGPGHQTDPNPLSNRYPSVPGKTLSRRLVPHGG